MSELLGGTQQHGCYPEKALLIITVNRLLVTSLYISISRPLVFVVRCQVRPQGEGDTD